MKAETRAIGVLYLDSREKGQLLSQATRGALDTLASEAGVAIENARLYRETLDKARIEHELRIAAEIQRSLLPQGRRDGTFFQAMGASLPSRSIGGDFFEYTDMDDGAIGVVLGDVAGKGPAAALLTAKIQGLFSAQAGDGSPASAMKLVNNGLLKRQIDARYATVFFATLTAEGVLTYCNAGHNPPMRGQRRRRALAGLGQRAGRAVLQRRLLRRAHPAGARRRAGDLQRRRDRGAQHRRRGVRRGAAVDRADQVPDGAAARPRCRR